MGPLELTDFIGQDINYQVSRQIWQDMQYDPRYTPGHLQRSLVDAGLLGKKNGCSYFSAEESPPPLAAAVDAEVGALRIYGEHPLFTLLQQRAALQWPRLRVEQRPTLAGLGAAIQVNAAFTVSVTDGRTANQLAEQTAADAFVVDVALNYGDTAYLVAAHSRHASAANKALFLRLLHTAIPQVEFIKDSPALIVARVLSSLINESVIMVESGVCSREDIDVAAVAGVNYAVAGVNYADGIFGWLTRLGEENVRTTLSNLAQLLHAARYAPHYTLLHAAQPALTTMP